MVGARYTFADVWRAMKQDKNFDYVFWIDVILQIMINKSFELLGYLLTFVAVLLISGLSFFGICYVIPAISTPGSLWAYFNYTFGPFLIFNILFNYISGVTISPGQPDFETDEEVEFGQGARSRTCKKCSRKRPARTHHCSICRTCVLKMDHHCPWLNNCVGYGNYRYFILFLFWTAVATLYFVLVLTPLVLQQDGMIRRENGLMAQFMDENTDMLRLIFLPFYNFYDFAKSSWQTLSMKEEEKVLLKKLRGNALMNHGKKDSESASTIAEIQGGGGELADQPKWGRRRRLGLDKGIFDHSKHANTVNWPNPDLPTEQNRTPKENPDASTHGRDVVDTQHKIVSMNAPRDQYDKSRGLLERQNGDRNLNSETGADSAVEGVAQSDLRATAEDEHHLKTHTNAEIAAEERSYTLHGGRIRVMGNAADIINMAMRTHDLRTLFPSMEIIFAVAWFVAIAIHIAIDGLLSYHCYLVFSGQTTLEHFNAVQLAARYRRMGLEYKNPYDFGFWGNFEEIFGSSLPWPIALLPSWRLPPPPRSPDPEVLEKARSDWERVVNLEADEFDGTAASSHDRHQDEVSEGAGAGRAREGERDPMHDGDGNDASLTRISGPVYVALTEDEWKAHLAQQHSQQQQQPQREAGRYSDHVFFNADAVNGIVSNGVANVPQLRVAGTNRGGNSTSSSMSKNGGASPVAASATTEFKDHGKQL